MSTKILRALICAWIAAGAVATATPARAAAMTSGWDPVATNGTAFFTLSDSCLTQGDGFFYTNGYDGGACSLGLVTATVNLVDPSPPPETTGMASFNLDYSSSESGADYTDVWGVDVAGGQVVGLDTFAIGPGVVSGNADSSLNGNWWIQWYDGFNSLDDGSGNLINTVSLYYNTGCDNSMPCLAEYTATNVTFTTTPEPGSLGLLLGGLGAGWWARRRKIAV